MTRRLNNSAISPVLTGALFLVGTLPASARDYFDPALLALAGDQAVTADLSSYETAGRVPEGRYLVSLWVNQADQGQHTLVFKKNAHGDVQPELTPAFLHQLGVNTTALPPFNGLPEQEPINDLATLITDAQVHFDLAQLRLDLSIPQIAMQQNARGSVDPALWDDGVPALVMNYSLSGSRSRQKCSGRDGQQRTDQPVRQPARRVELAGMALAQRHDLFTQPDRWRFICPHNAEYSFY